MGKVNNESNVDKRIFDLQQEQALLNKRIDMLEERLLLSKQEMQRDVLMMVGTILSEVGNKIVNTSRPESEFIVNVIDEQETANENTFHALRTKDDWALKLINNGENHHIDRGKLIPAMHQAIQAFLNSLPETQTNVSFNVYSKGDSTQ